MPEFTSVSPRHPRDERYAFNYFLHRSAPIFAGIIDGAFWLELVPRLAQYHDFVWDSVVAAAWMFEHVEYNDLTVAYDSNDPSLAISVDHRRALKWYHRALANFRNTLDKGEVNTAYVLLSCVLFSALEFQQ